MFCMPGIGRQGGDIKSVFEATEGIPAYGIIGSAIYKAPNIRAAAKRFCDEALEF
jgi:orotidine-5'-phosphate decarboxylase